MTEDLYLAPYFCDDALASGDVQRMARRQFGASIVVSLAFVALMALIGARTAQFAPPAPPAPHAAMQSAPSRLAPSLPGAR